MWNALPDTSQRFNRHLCTMREAIQMSNAREVVHSYDGAQPLVQHVKNYCRSNKNIGSRDRKILNELVFGYYRKKGNRSHNDKYFVYAAKGNALLHAFYQFWRQELQIEEEDQTFDGYFPLEDHIAEAVNKPELLQSHLHQPAVWIRCKHEHILEVLDDLDAHQYACLHDGDRIRFTELYPLQDLTTFKEGFFEIQDIASQEIITLMHPKKNEAWWDCCAGSGGKSLLLLEKEKQIQLFVSDVRESILQNLTERFQRAGVTNYNAYVADLVSLSQEDLLQIPDFNGIIADLPCSGSGTWSRTPEWLTFFTEEKLHHYAALQRKIAGSAIKKLLPGGVFMYITCSVYREENEENVQWLLKNGPVELTEQKYFQFSAAGGDTLFGAVFKRRN